MLFGFVIMNFSISQVILIYVPHPPHPYHLHLVTLILKVS